MFSRVVSALPSPIAIARALADRPGLALLHTADAPGVSYVACDPDGESRALDPLEGAAAPSADPELASVPLYIGALPYEAFRSLERPRWSPPEDRAAPLACEARWQRFPAVLRVDETKRTVVALGSSEGAVADLARRASAAESETIETNEIALETSPADSDEAHAARVRRAIELIYAGDLYQVNIARRIDLTLRERGARPSARAYVELYARLVERAGPPFGAAIFRDDATILSTSPELCLAALPSSDHRSFDRLITDPIKGTRPRGPDRVIDALLAKALDEDEKERAELTMIIDVERNDLNRVSIPGTVKLVDGPRVTTLRTVHHRHARIEGRARPGVSRDEILRAFLPSGSVTGAPKVRAMEVIRTLEPHRRGLYTGALGYLSHGGEMVLSMAIRTAVFAPSGDGSYFAGGGIVADSVPEREVEETHWKSAQLSRTTSRPT